MRLPTSDFHFLSQTNVVMLLAKNVKKCRHRKFKKIRKYTANAMHAQLQPKLILRHRMDRKLNC